MARTVRGRGHQGTQLPRVWTSEEVAARWSITHDTVCEMFRRGDVPGAFKTGRVWRIREDAICQFEARSGSLGGSTPYPLDQLSMEGLS